MKSSYMMVTAMISAFTTSLSASHSFGTLVECTTEEGCLWMSKKNQLVKNKRILHEMLISYHYGDNYEQAKRNLEDHIEYIEAVYMHAHEMQHDMSMKMGLNPRHLFEDASALGNPLDVVLVNIQSSRPERRLDTSSAAQATSNMPTTLNWCTDNNPQKRSVCADVKSQQLCGSCWAFAASDLIETAVSYTTKSPPVSLSAQQLLSCSTSAEVRTYTYCFAKSGSIPTWLEPTMKWDSKNNGCSGGMTHIALGDAANKIMNLASRIDWPYVDQSVSAGNNAPVGPSTGAKSTNSSSNGSGTGLNVCGTSRPASATAAHISGWAPAFDTSSCADTKDPVLLLKRALQQGPLAVAVNAKGGFKGYKKDVYICGSITSPELIDHALLLVGYDTSDIHGDYWILKNSYGVDWGQSGYIWLKADKELNCGLNVFPIRVQGASAGPAANITVDGGGTLSFAGASMWTWVVIGSIVGVGTIVLTIIGIIVSRKRISQMHL